jgi:F-type H+-transporting ATPase subunit a
MKILSGFIFNFIIKSPLFFILGIIPMLVFTAVMALELAVAFIQAIVFVILTSSYIRDSIILH